GIACVSLWGVVGGAIATVIAAAVAATTSFTIGFRAFGLTLPLGHLLRIFLATMAMAAALRFVPDASSYVMLAAHIAFGAAVYSVALAFLYISMLSRRLRHRLQRSGA
ncbi:MAG: hypothetical protein WBA48_12720, partial [Xanthobacteraceae bacterium]